MPHARVFPGAAVIAALCAMAAPAQATTFSYTGAEQTYTVPGDVSNLQITAIGGAGGTPDMGNGLPGGRAAVVTGIVPVTPGQVLYVYVGGAGGLAGGGFNGGGDGGVTQEFGMAWGGGGASDVSTVPDSAGIASLQARVIVAAGGGGSAGIAAAGGDAGLPGGCCGAVGHGPNAAQPGTQSAGGVGGGCPTLTEGCGGNGGLGFGGDGGASGSGADARAGGGGGGGLYGGGGGAGNISDTGGGAGGSSLITPGGIIALAPSTTTPARIDIDPYVPPPPPARCADLIDNDGDGRIDFPADRGCDSASDNDETDLPPILDTTPPTASLSGRRTQTLSRWVVVALRCTGGEDCIVSAKGKLSIRGTSRRYALRSTKRGRVPHGMRVTLKLGVPAKARGAAKRALRHNRKVRATVTITVADTSGNAKPLTRSINLVR